MMPSTIMRGAFFGIDATLSAMRAAFFAIDGTLSGMRAAFFAIDATLSGMHAAFFAIVATFFATRAAFFATRLARCDAIEGWAVMATPSRLRAAVARSGVRPE